MSSTRSANKIELFSETDRNNFFLLNLHRYAKKSLPSRDEEEFRCNDTELANWPFAHFLDVRVNAV